MQQIAKEQVVRRIQAENCWWEHPQKPIWAIEVKWSNRSSKDPKQLKSLLAFCAANKLKEAIVTTLTDHFTIEHNGIKLHFVPTSVYCWTVGYNIVKNSNII